MFTVKLANHYFQIDGKYPSIRTLCQDYTCDEQLGPVIKASEEDILKEQDVLQKYPLDYLETLAIYRQICEKIVFDDVLLVHGSVLRIDRYGIMFTAKSGTGKSTQARLWREYFQERITMINDDKPLVHVGIKNNVYGTPWCGKHGLQTNTSCVLKTIFIVEQATHNSIEKIDYQDVYPELMKQVYRPQSTNGMIKMLELFKVFIKNVDIYRLKCNISYEAVEMAYEVIKEKVNEID